MTDRAKYKVHQVIPGDGWRVVYATDGERRSSPVVAWALVTDNEDDEPFLMPMTAEESWAGIERDSNAEGLTHPSGMWEPFEWPGDEA